MKEYKCIGRKNETNSEKKIKMGFSSDFSSANHASINSISTELSFKKWASLSSSLLYTSPSPRDKRESRMPSCA